MRFLSIIPLVLLCSSALAQSPESAKATFRNAAAIPPARKAAAWSVVGEWQCTHPAWTDTVKISADGTFSRTNNEVASAGRWSLGGLQDGVILVLAWNKWPTQIVVMVGPDEFLGKVGDEQPFGEMVMRRVQPPAAKSVDPVVETRSWHQGEPPVRLIRKEEGFCALSRVTGHFQGGGETVKVYIGEDGYWYLGGESMQNDVAADCIVVRFR